MSASNGSSGKQLVVITGANQGIGWEAAKAILNSSSNFHVFVGSRSVERGQKAVAELTGLGIKGSVSLVQLDVTDDKSVANAVKQIERDHGRVDALINNAGITVQDGSMKHRLTKTFDTNAIAPALVTEAFLPLLKKSHNPRLIYVTSDLGSITNKSNPDYVYSKLPAIEYRMSKAALNMLAVCHHMHLKEFGIKVFTMNPGFCVTNLTGEENRKTRIDMGAQSAEVPAVALAKIVAGKCDDGAGKFLDSDAEAILPW